MMKKTIIAALLSLVTMAAQAQIQTTTALTGTWSGKLNVGPVSLTIVLHIEQKDDHVAVTLDSPDQGAKGLSAKKEYLTDDSIAISMDYMGAAYQARLIDGKLDGKFSQGGMSLPLVLAKGTFERIRPQRPAPPYPYSSEEVTFRNEADGATLVGTLTWPVGYDSTSKKKPAVVIFVSGSGQQNRNEELMGHEPFLVIADHLARHGIASLRYDDRATGASTGGDVKNATSVDFMRDAAAGIQYLRQRKAFAKVGCLGHSEGGLIAFLLSARKQTDFIITLAAPGVKGDTLLTLQNNRILQLSGQEANSTVKQLRKSEEVAKTPWLKWFIDYDPSDNIRRTRCPAFVLNGDRDCQVISSQNLPPIRQLLRKSKKNVIKEYPSLNHLFQHCTTGLPTEYGDIEETIAPEVLEDITKWIQSL